MKGITVITAIMLVSSMMFLLSCSSNGSSVDEMKKPEVSNQNQVAINPSDHEIENEDDEDAETGAMTGKGNASTMSTAVALNFENMKEAFKGETTASAKYADYSKRAEKEGYHHIALLFKAASISEKTHADNHKSVLLDAGQVVPQITPVYLVQSTKENLMDAIKGETYEITTMYPLFLTNANAVGNQLSLISLNYAYKTEQKHKPLYEKALATLENNTQQSLPAVYYVCPTCGNTYEGTPPKRCGISMTGGDKFVKVSTVTS